MLERLVAFFAADTGVALRAETGDLFPAIPNQTIDGLNVVRAALKVLGPRSESAKMLLARARGRAKGVSVKSLCAEAGWQTATLNRRVAIACEDVAAWLNWRHEALASDTNREDQSLPASTD